MRPAKDITQLLYQWSRGDDSALERLTPAVYAELRGRARNYLRKERRDHTLQATALIHEAYLRLIKQDMPEWRSRTHFFAVAAHIMRQVLVDHARKHQCVKRGAGSRKVSLEDAILLSDARETDLLSLDRALDDLAAFDARKARIVELRYFGGCTVEETAASMGISVATIYRESRVAEAWLRKAMSAAEAAQGTSRGESRQPSEVGN